MVDIYLITVDCKLDIDIDFGVVIIQLMSFLEIKFADKIKIFISKIPIDTIPIMIMLIASTILQLIHPYLN